LKLQRLQNKFFFTTGKSQRPTTARNLHIHNQTLNMYICTINTIGTSEKNTNLFCPLRTLPSFEII
jgi:hypothetical protein